MKHICEQCDRCERLVKETEAAHWIMVDMNNKKLTLCNECANDLLKGVYQKPELLFGDETVNVK